MLCRRSSEKLWKPKRFESDSNRIRIEQRLSAVRGLMDRASEDKLSGKIPEDFWTRKMAE